MTFLRCGRQTTRYPVQSWKVILNSVSNISDSAHLRVPCKTLVVWSRCSQRVHWSPTVALELILWREIFSKGTRTHKRQCILPNKAGGEGGEGSGSLLTTFDNIPSGILGTRYPWQNNKFLAEWTKSQAQHTWPECGCICCNWILVLSLMMSVN
jgi:hypothetical protein